MRREARRLACWMVVGLLSGAAPVLAQAQAPQPAEAPANDAAAEALINRLKSESGSIEWVSGNHVRFKGGVEQEIAADTKLFADDVEWFLDTNRLVASGNVVFAGPEGRIAAARVEFNTA